MQNKYTQDKHKIRGLWDDVIQLIAIEEEILTKLDGLEKSVQILSKKINNLQGMEE